MNLLLNKFLDILEGEKALYLSLLSVLQLEKKAVIDSKFKELNENSKKKENLILKIRILEEQRVKLLKKLCDLFNYPLQNIDLLILSQLVDEPYSTRLKEYHSNLSALIESIQEINHANKDLITHSLELVKGSLFLLNNLMGSSSVYYRTGKIHNSEQGGIVLSGKI